MHKYSVLKNQEIILLNDSALNMAPLLLVVAALKKSRGASNSGKTDSNSFYSGKTSLTFS